jgi:hypothetical protein
MPLSPPSKRDPVHTRQIQCRGYRRDDGLWDIEGHLLDTKSAKPSETNKTPDDVMVIHDMWLRLTIDDALMVHDAEAVMDISPYRICPDIAPNFDNLSGIRIKPGWRQEANRRVGGVKGCTHLVELLGPMATVCYQTLYGGGPTVDATQNPSDGAKKRSPPQQKPHFINKCHAHRSDGDIVKKYWPEFYTDSHEK